MLTALKLARTTIQTQAKTPIRMCSQVTRPTIDPHVEIYKFHFNVQMAPYFRAKADYTQTGDMRIPFLAYIDVNPSNAKTLLERYKDKFTAQDYADGLLHAKYYQQAKISDLIKAQVAERGLESEVHAKLSEIPGVPQDIVDLFKSAVKPALR